MKDMTGWWGWRGSRGSQAGDPAPASQAYAAAQERDADIADGNGADAGIAHGGADPGPGHGDGAEDAAAKTGTRRPAHRDGADEASNGIPAQRPSAPAGRVPREPTVPRALQRAADWSWRLLLIGLLIYVAFRVASALALVVLPCIAALLLTALLQPLTARLRRTGMPSLAATWCTVMAAVVILAGLGILTANRVSADYPRLQKEVKHTAHEVQSSLAGAPFHLSSTRLDQYYEQFTHFVSQHQSLIAGTVVTGGRIVLELLTGLILMIFITFFLLKDGDRIWAWLIKGLPPEAKRRAGNAGPAAWTALVNYVRGTTAVAAIHAVFIGLALWILGVPLLVPLIILVFLAAYIPLVGILVAGAAAILVTLGTKGWIAAVILLGVFILENQIEGHLLQPLVVGRIVRLHPLAIILVLAVGGIIAGIAGAIVAVPAAAAISYAWPYLRGESPEPPDGGA
jgi:predicted PurR-regulated permease PerM